MRFGNMEKITQRDKILSLLETAPTNWFYSWQLIKVNTPKGWLGSGADRTARLMSEENKILRKHEGKYAMYSLKTRTTLF